MPDRRARFHSTGRLNARCPAQESESLTRCICGFFKIRAARVLTRPLSRILTRPAPHRRRCLRVLPTWHSACSYLITYAFEVDTISVIFNQPRPGVFELNIQDTLETQDYRKFAPIVDAFIEEYGKAHLPVRLPTQLKITPGALWEDLKFGVAHINDIERLAIVSDNPSQSWLASIASPFTSAEVRFFPGSELDEARAWIGKLDS